MILVHTVNDKHRYNLRGNSFFNMNLGPVTVHYSNDVIRSIKASVWSSRLHSFPDMNSNTELYEAYTCRPVKSVCNAWDSFEVYQLFIPEYLFYQRPLFLLLQTLPLCTNKLFARIKITSTFVASQISSGCEIWSLWEYKTSINIEV